jgi:hypothetical protein
MDFITKLVYRACGTATFDLEPYCERIDYSLNRPLSKRGNLVNFIVERLATVLIYLQ